MSDTEKTTNTTTYSRATTSLEKVDETMPYRFVGSYEYMKAIEAFEKLISISTPEDLQAYDLVLINRPEFTYFNGANVALGNKPNLRQANSTQRNQFYDTFRKKGLAWMMALAKVELSATASMYGDAKKPFQAIATSQFDTLPYLTVLADDVAAHMRSLSQEQGFHKVTRSGRKIDTWTLAYLRRLKLIRDMIETLGDANSQVKFELKKYDGELAKYERRLNRAVAAELNSVQSGSNQSQSVREGSSRQRINASSIAECRQLVTAHNSGSGNVD